MKKLLLSLSIAMSFAAFSQTTLFTDDFESGSGNWVLNGGSGDNSWIVNNIYAGFPLIGIVDTPNEPAGIANGPQSMYMHIVNGTICGAGICNANFDTGSASNQASETAASVNASSYTNVTVSFWYLCAGQAGTSYGSTEYSVDGGITWVSTGDVYHTTSIWTQETVTMPAWDNAPAFKFRFRWQNGAGGLDPAFSIDDFEIQGTSGGASNTITTGTNLMPTSWCEGNLITMQVDFTSTGTFNAGNVYSAELSDATGSFAAPTVVGTLASTANSGMIIAMIPALTPAGNGYRIRVVSDNPATTGSDNGTDLVINPLPTVSLGAFSNVCDNVAPFALSGGLPAGGTYSGPGVSGGMFDPAAAGVGAHTITYTYTDPTTTCSNFTTQSITVDACSSNTITTGTNLLPTDWCEGNMITMQVDFTSTGTFNAGNVYSAQLSDATGSFAAPTVIGTLASTANSGMIVAIIPGSTPAGNGYRIRVVSDNPVTIGSNNGTDLVINALPTVTLASFSDVCDYTPTFVLTGGTPAGGTYSGAGVSGGMFDPATAGIGTQVITYSYTDPTTGCSNVTNNSIVVSGCASVFELDNQTVSVYPNPASSSFVIETQSTIDGVTLLDMNGRIVKAFDTNDNIYNVESVKSGVYLLKIEEGQNVQTIRFVVK